MCRRSITHRMHHDVQSSMILDTQSTNPTVLSNPFRTSFHRCGVSQPRPDYIPNFLSEIPPPCEYHSCCVPSVEVYFCDDAIPPFSLDQEYGGYDDACYEPESDPEPEECDGFMLEHRHERLPYLGHPGAYVYSGRFCEATWCAGMRQFQLEEIPDAMCDKRHFVKWLERLFFEAEKLFTVRQDLEIHGAVMTDLHDNRPFQSTETFRLALIAEGNCVRAANVFNDQVETVNDLMRLGQ